MNHRAALLALLAALVYGTSALGTAHAGSYQVDACAGAPGNLNHSWTAFDTNPSYLETSSNCGAPDVTGGGGGSGATSGLAASDVLQLSTNVPAGATAGWTFQAPVGTKITGASWDRDLFEQSDGWTPEVLDGSGNVLSGETCQFVAENGGCEIDGTTSHSNLSTGALTIELVCTPQVDNSQTCGNGFSEHEGRVELNSAAITITDSNPPSITATGGTLFASGYQHGTLSASVSGNDSIGVQYARVYIDGKQVAQQSFSCDFTYIVPCPTSVSGQLEVNTATLPDGIHQTQVSLADAAGNETMSSPQTLMISNNPPPAPTGGEIQGHTSGWTSQPATLTWMNPSLAQGPPINTVYWTVCRGTDLGGVPAGGCDGTHTQISPLTSLTFDPTQDPMFEAQPISAYTAFVWLGDAAGNSSQANAMAVHFGYDNTAPGPPEFIMTSPTTGPGPFAITVGASPHVAPIIGVDWTACDSSGNCLPMQSTPGLTFTLDPTHNSEFQGDPYGTYTIRAWLVDAAANSDPNAFATANVTTAPALASSNAGTSSGSFSDTGSTSSSGSGRSGASGGSASAPSPQLHITSVAEHGRRLLIHGTVARKVHGYVVIVETFLERGRKQTMRRTAKIAAGRWSILLTLPAGAQPQSTTVAVHPTCGRWRHQSVTRHTPSRSSNGRKPALAVAA